VYRKERPDMKRRAQVLLIIATVSSYLYAQTNLSPPNLLMILVTNGGDRTTLN
jgi:hypothetical protein